MTTHDKFTKDLKQGEADERYLASFFVNKHNCSVIDYNPNNDSQYDIKIIMNGKEELLEVKSDRYEKYKGDTGNICVEMYCSNKPSGVKTSKSTIYCFFFPDKNFIYMIRTEKLRQLIQDFGNQMGFFTNGGDGGRTKGVLINREDWKKHFKVIHLI